MHEHEDQHLRNQQHVGFASIRDVGVLALELDESGVETGAGSSSGGPMGEVLRSAATTGTGG